MSPHDGNDAVREKDPKQAAAASSPPSPPWWSFSSIRGRIEDEMDEQRHERLAQCRSLELVLADCRARTPNRTQLEDVPAGIRMVRYFDWRDVPDPHCQREAHAVWACRAVALKCGKELIQVRDCFRNYGAMSSGSSGDHINNNNKTAILNHRTGSAAYEPSDAVAVRGAADADATSDISMNPCAKVQQILGRCVSANAHALLERDAARRQK
jgi:hypothetical protein